MALIITGLATVLSSCKDDGNPPNNDPIILECSNLVDSDSTLTLQDRSSGVDYIINCEARVFGDLVIQPGVTIQFGSNGALEIRDGGSMEAIGTQNDPITFTGEDKVAGAWGYIAFESDDVKNRMEFCIVEYGGSFAYSSNGDQGNVIMLAQSRLSMANCTLRHSEEYGLRIPSHDTELPEFDNNVITACNIPAVIPANLVQFISGGSYLGNTNDYILIETAGFANSATISGADERWEALDAPYRVGKDIRITSGKLTIAPGTVIEFENGTAIDIGDSDAATLVAVGTQTDTILFTGVTKSPGAWDGIYFSFTNSPENEIAFATIEFSGSQDYEGAIAMWAEPTVNVHDVRFRDIETCAFYAKPNTSSPNANLTESNNTTVRVAGGYLCGD